eukprot:3672091-Pyramimonas_sp.AAC.1
MATLSDRLLETPGSGKCSHGRGAPEVPMGFDGARNEWRTAKKKTYPGGLCRILADATVDCVNHMFVTCADTTYPCDMQEDKEQLRAE